MGAFHLAKQNKNKNKNKNTHTRLEFSRKCSRKFQENRRVPHSPGSSYGMSVFFCWGWGGGWVGGEGGGVKWKAPNTCVGFPIKLQI